MPLINGENAVFYHPLDSYAEHVSAALWDGAARFVSGRVGFAMGGSAPTLSFGGDSAFSAIPVVSSPPLVVAMGSGRVALVYIADANSAWLRVGQASGPALAWGDPQQLASGYADAVAVAQLGPDTLVVSQHRMGEPESDLWVADVVGTAVAVTAAAPVPGRVWGLAGMSSDRIVACFADGSVGRSAVGEVSGAAVTFGASTDFAAAPSDAAVLSLSSSVAVVVYEDSVSSAQSVRAGTVSGSGTVQWAAPFPLAAGQGQPCFSLTRLTVSLLAVGYCDAEGAKARLAGVSAGVVTLGDPTDVFPGPVSVSAIGLSQVAMVYRTPTSPDDRGTSTVAEAVGLALLPGAVTQFSVPSGSMWHPAVAASGDEAFIAYREGTDGKARVGGVAQAAAGVYGDGASHPAAAGETKLVFLSWVRSPG